MASVRKYLVAPYSSSSKASTNFVLTFWLSGEFVKGCPVFPLEVGFALAPCAIGAMVNVALLKLDVLVSLCASGP